MDVKEEGNRNEESQLILIVVNVVVIEFLINNGIV